jgi:hypothetical protein
MTCVVGVHGIGNYTYIARSGGNLDAAIKQISQNWSASLNSGLGKAGVEARRPEDLRVAYYAHLLHRGTSQGAADDPGHLDDHAQSLLVAWVQELTSRPVPQLAQGPLTARARAAADWLSRHYPETVRRAAISFCREVGTYQAQQNRRKAVREMIAETIRAQQPDILIGHSLGSVIAYEALHASPDLKIRLLLTIGSPLAMPGVIFNRLDPAPVNNRGTRPPGVGVWANIADVGDIVAIPRGGMTHRFDGVSSDTEAIISKRAFHGVQHYLACTETAKTVIPFL